MDRQIAVKGKKIGGDAGIFFTAEIGVSHMGHFKTAKRLMLGAKESGCDGADMFMASGEDFYYCGDWPGKETDSRRDWEKQSFSEAQWKELFAYADEIGLVLYVTPLDLPSIEMARRLKSPMVNVNSDDTNNPVYLEEVATLGVPVTLHNINATLAEVEAAVRVLRDSGCHDIVLLHSTQETGDESKAYATANLNVMHTYRQAFSCLGVLAGCVEHTTSDFLVYAVAALKPVLISKHLLLQHGEEVPDDRASVDIAGLSEMVKKVRYVEMSLGDGLNCRVLNEGEERGIKPSARSKVLVAARDLPAGHTVQKGDIVAKRPGHKGGLHPWKVYQLYGAKTASKIQKDSLLDFNQFCEFPETEYKFPSLETKTFSGRRFSV